MHFTWSLKCNIVVQNIKWNKIVKLLHAFLYKYYHLSRIVRKPDFCLGENKGADQLRGNLISAFVFATRIVQFLFYLNPKFQASSSFLSLYRPVCVGPGRKPRRPVFSRLGSILSCYTRKPLICIGKNKDADQLCSYYTADQCLCFCSIDGMMPLLTKSKISFV